MPGVNRPGVTAADVLEVLPVGVVVLDAVGHVVLWNDAAERLTGWPRDEVLGVDAGAVASGRPTVARVLAELRAGRPFRGRLPGVMGEGRSVYFRATPDPSGVVVGVLQEVADTAAEDEAFALLDALWETAPVGLAYFDVERRYRRVNGAILAIDGGTADERLGHTLEQVHGPTGARIDDILVSVLVGGVPRSDVRVAGRLWHGRGPHQEWRINAYPVRSSAGTIVGVGMVLADVTGSERTRRELAEVAAQREHALGLYQSLVEATSAAVWTRQPDGSTVHDAPGLRAITGQSAAEHRGFGFLDAVHPVHRAGLAASWRAAAAAVPAQVFTRAYRLRTAAGGYRWFSTRAVPVHAGGRVVEWVGTETDIDDGIRARDRLDVLARATFAMNAALDPEAELGALATAVVPDFADVCRIYLIDAPGVDAPGVDPTGTGPARQRPGPGGHLTGRRSSTHCAPGIAPPPQQEHFSFAPSHPVARSVHSGAPVLVETPTVHTETWRSSAAQQRWAEEIGATSMLVAPVIAGGTAVAALMFVACGDRPPYTGDDHALVAELATRASRAVETASEFQLSRQVSVALQAATLSAPPRYPGVEIEARYQPAAAQLQIGGDWYDAFALPGGDLALGVGDVVGHDLPAAATMGQLRSMLRGLAHDSEAAPAVVVSRLDQVATGLAVTRFTTLIYGRLARAGGRTTFRWSNAGHPPPLLVPPGGPPRPLTGSVDVVLGVDPDRPRREQEIEIPPGSTLLLYTDGLVERRVDPDDLAAAELIDLVAGAVDLPLPEFCDHLLRGTASDTGDDIVVLALRLDPE